MTENITTGTETEKYDYHIDTSDYPQRKVRYEIVSYKLEGEPDEI